MLSRLHTALSMSRDAVRFAGSVQQKRGKASLPVSQPCLTQDCYFDNGNVTEQPDLRQHKMQIYMWAETLSSELHQAFLQPRMWAQ